MKRGYRRIIEGDGMKRRERKIRMKKRGEKVMKEWRGENRTWKITGQKQRRKKKEKIRYKKRE